MLKAKSAKNIEHYKGEFTILSESIGDRGKLGNAEQLKSVLLIPG
jgi:hypothetical protein